MFRMFAENRENAKIADSKPLAKRPVWRARPPTAAASDCEIKMYRRRRERFPDPSDDLRPAEMRVV